MKKTVERANAFIQEHSGKTKGRYRPRYHACVPVGWANDPNGLIFYEGKAHLFCQYNPYHPDWESMHWGHFVSRDLVRWEFLPVALAPVQKYDCGGGCFSGTALEREGKLILMYTGVAKDVQQQCIALSNDGIIFEKAASNPVIPASLLPEGCSGRDFRDPKVFEREGIFYCITGVKDGEWGNLLLFRSSDLLEWSFVGRLLSPKEDDIIIDGVCECPDYLEVDGKEFLLFCAMNYPEREGRFQNVHSSLYMTGHLDLSSGRFSPETFDELDAGFDFYAPFYPSARTSHCRRRAFADACQGDRNLSLRRGFLSEYPSFQWTYPPCRHRGDGARAGSRLFLRKCQARGRCPLSG